MHAAVERPNENAKKSLRHRLNRLFWPYLPLLFLFLTVIVLVISTINRAANFTPDHDPTKRDGAAWFWIKIVGSSVESFFEANITGITATILSALTTYLIYDRYFMQDIVEDEQRTFAEYVAEYLSKNASQGLLSVKEKLDYAYAGDLLSNSNNVVIIDTWLGHEALQGIKKGLFEALEHNCSIKIYVLHPNSVSTPRRSYDLNPHNAQSGREEVLQSLKLIKGFRDEWVSQHSDTENVENIILGRLEVFCYDFLPTLQIYKFQDRVIIGFFLKEVLCTSGYQFEIELRSPLGLIFLEHIKKYQLRTTLTATHITPVFLDRDIYNQFDRVHLACQLYDAAKQVINLSPSEVEKFSDELIGLLLEEKRLEYRKPRKENLLSALNRIHAKLDSSVPNEL